MYKRWQGNTGLVSREEESAAPPPRPPLPGPPPPPGPPPGLPFLGRLEGILGALETEDLLLMAILYLLYRESGDSEWLLVLGAMLFV